MPIWMRVGDPDDYHAEDSLDGVVERLQMMGVKTPLVRDRRYGVSTDGYSGDNYISLYCGNGGEPTREMTPAEIDEINRRLGVAE